ncbi:MAG: choice-of-anchor Q domain-containing protein, partial [Pseudomonadota bacterium]
QALSILPFETSGGRTPSSIAAGSIEISSRRMPVVIEGAHIVGAEGVTVVGAGAGPSRISIRQSLFQRNASIALIAGDAGFEGDVILSDTTMHDNGAILFRGRGFPPSLTVLRAGYLTLTDNDAITIERITDGASLSIANSIFFGNGAVACRYTPDEPDVSPTIRLASLGPDGAENCIFDVSGDPTLGPLQANPGPLATLTRLPAAGSVVIDRATFCPDGSTDQRGVARPVGAACDFGAVERD